MKNASHVNVKLLLKQKQLTSNIDLDCLAHLIQIRILVKERGLHLDNSKP